MNGVIASIEAFDVVVPLPRPLQLGAFLIPHREYVLVRVRDGKGLMGSAVGLTRNAPVAATILRAVAPYLTACSLKDYDGKYEAILQANVPLGTNGIFWRAISLVDCAVHDLMAQRAGLPLYAFLGGQRQAIPCVLVGGYPTLEETRESLQDQARQMAGLEAAVIKIGSCGDFVRDTQRLRDMRDAVPDGPPLAMDFYWQCHRPETLLEGTADWNSLRMAWVEDPVAFDDYESAATLSRGLSFSVAIGDEQSGVRNFERLMDTGGIGIVRLDATVCGGVKTFLSIARAAEERGLPVACHVFHPLHVHLACAAPAVKFVEQFVPGSGFDSLDRLWLSDLPMRGGCLRPPETPGIGWNWNEEAIECYRKEKTYAANPS